MGPGNRQCGDGGKAGPPPAQVVGNHPCPRGLLLNPNGFPAWIRLCIEMGLIPFTQPAKAGEVQCAVKKEKIQPQNKNTCLLQMKVTED